jgi:hypothetical protein
MLRTDDALLMLTIAAELEADLRQHGLADDLHIETLKKSPSAEVTRGDLVSWSTIAITAVGTGGALTVLLGKEGFLSALARVLEKYVEGKKGEVTIETFKGDKIHVVGPLGDIKAVLRQAQKSVPQHAPKQTPKR